MPNQQLPSILGSALARLNRRASHVDPSSAALALADGHEPVVITDHDGCRTELALSDIPEFLPPRTKRVTIPASFAPREVASALSRFVAQRGMTELVLRRPPCEPVDLTPLALLGQLESLTVESDWSYPSARRSLLRPWRLRLDLGPLSELSRLRQLTLRCESNVVGLEPLASLTDLRELRLSGEISDLGPLRHLQHIEKLSLLSRVLKDIRPLDALPALTDLDLHWSKVADLEPLCESFRIEVLRLGGTRVCDVSPLTELARLEELSLGYTRVTELAPLAGLNLRKLFLTATRVADLRPLADCRLLAELCLANTAVTDVSPLARLPRLRKLSVARTGVRSAQLRALHLPNTRVQGLRVFSARDSDDHQAQPRSDSEDYVLFSEILAETRMTGGSAES